MYVSRAYYQCMPALIVVYGLLMHVAYLRLRKKGNNQIKTVQLIERWINQIIQVLHKGKFKRDCKESLHLVNSMIECLYIQEFKKFYNCQTKDYPPPQD